jgi:hypothetical protein
MFVSFALNNALLQIGSDAPMIHHQLAYLLFQLHTIRDVRRDPFSSFFSGSFSSLGTHHAHTFRNFKQSCIMLYAEPWEHASVVATLPVGVLLSAQINVPTNCTVTSITVSAEQPGQASYDTFICHWENFSTNPVFKKRTRIPIVNPQVVSFI